ncbi:unnamed protein product [Protopolystoma xenopodis]|uniref:Uncharacterized protein n=1 Tax=Protopolystoma xenopodis TaxID=117903 RepID=A0A3S5AXH7_9PLAT|nr:unnamed protein product [Protopolystoma xenopodis]
MVIYKPKNTKVIRPASLRRFAAKATEKLCQTCVTSILRDEAPPLRPNIDSSDIVVLRVQTGSPMWRCHPKAGKVILLGMYLAESAIRSTLSAVELYGQGLLKRRQSRIG